MRRLLAVILLVVLALVAATGTSLADPYEEGNFTPINGGEAWFANGNFHWVAPASAYPSTLAIRLSANGESNLPPRPANTIVIGQPYRLLLIERSTSAPISLQQPYTLTIRYNPADLGGRSEATLHIARNFGHWENIPTSVNTTDHTVTIQTTLGGDFVLLADNQAPAPAPAPQQAYVAAPMFKLGFATLAGLIPDVVGTPVEEEHYGTNGDSLQQTTNGLMVWRKADNWTAFTNGSWTWINGPFGVQSRSNAERFAWEQ